MLGSNLRLNSFNISNAAGSFGTGNWLAFSTACLLYTSQANGISSIYAQFEPNGYDEQDADWQTGASHSVAGKGSLEVYFTREQNGNIAQQTIDAATSDAKFDTSRNEFGIRNSEW